MAGKRMPRGITEAGWGPTLGSVGTALYCLEQLQRFANDERQGALTEEEVQQCFDCNVYAVRRTKMLHSNHVVDVWECAQWCRVIDVQRWVGSNKNRLKVWKDSGAFGFGKHDWFDGQMTMKLQDALFLRKAQMLRKFLKLANGAVDRLDTEGLTMLPLETLLGIITDVRLARMMLTPYGAVKNMKW